MFDSLFTTSATSVSLSLAPLAACVATALALGLLLACLYCFRNRHTASFAVTLALVPAIVCVIIALVNGNVGAGVAVMGTFSLVRFRSIPGSARDIGFVFLAMCVGLACGMGYVALAALVTLAIGGAYLILTLAGFGTGSAGRYRALRVTVPEDLDFCGMFDDILERYTTQADLASIKTAGMGSLYRLVYNVRLREGASERDLIDELRCRNGNLEVALTHQAVSNDEL